MHRVRVVFPVLVASVQRQSEVGRNDRRIERLVTDVEIEDLRRIVADSKTRASRPLPTA